MLAASGALFQGRAFAMPDHEELSATQDKDISEGQSTCSTGKLSATTRGRAEHAHVCCRLREGDGSVHTIPNPHELPMPPPKAMLTP